VNSPPNAEFVSQSVPSEMAAYQLYNVSVTMKNTGDRPWTDADKFRLGSANPQDNVTWGWRRVHLPPGVSVAPGASYKFAFTVAAPGEPGIYNFQWRMVQTGVQWFGQASSNIAVNVAHPPPYRASFISQVVPASMSAGVRYAVSVTMRNTGTKTWTAAEKYRLGSENPRDNKRWGLERVAVPANVLPGTNVTFSFTVTAPASGGVQNFQWRMLREGVTWFGDLTPNVAVNVIVRNAAFVSQSVPTTMAAGASYPVSITVQNTGATVWTSSEKYRLGSQNPTDNVIWGGFNRVLLPASVDPGGTVTFNFKVTAPSSPGTYNFQWRMLQEGVQWFGSLTQNLQFEVR
jgi:hypothetical protein